MKYRDDLLLDHTLLAVSLLPSSLSHIIYNSKIRNPCHLSILAFFLKKSSHYLQTSMLGTILQRH